MLPWWHWALWVVWLACIIYLVMRVQGWVTNLQMWGEDVEERLERLERSTRVDFD